MSLLICILLLYFYHMYSYIHWNPFVYEYVSEITFFFFFFILTRSARQTKSDTFANSIDPDETAGNELSHQDLQWLAVLFILFIYLFTYLFIVWLFVLFCFVFLLNRHVNVRMYKDGRIHYRNRDEWVGLGRICLCLFLGPRRGQLLFFFFCLF